MIDWEMINENWYVFYPITFSALVLIYDFVFNILLHKCKKKKK